MKKSCKKNERILKEKWTNCEHIPDEAQYKGISEN